jgi:folate-binding protein YgfZ
MLSEEGYRALTTRSGVVRRRDRGVLTVTGTDRLEWLQGLLTNDVAALDPGSACDAAYLTPQGRMITDLRVLHFADRTLLDVPAVLSASLTARLDGLLFSEEASIADSSDHLSVIELHGPTAPEIAASQADFVRDDAYGVPGFVAVVSSSDVEAFVSQLVASGALEVSLETLDVVRIEAGRPAFLIDMDEHTIPLEAGLEKRAISFSKGCYVGQEVIVRVTHRGGGRVAKRLVGLRLATGQAPRAGDLISAEGREVGRVTSAAWSPTLNTAIALGYLHRDFTDPGTKVAINGSNGSLPAEVTSLPLVAR